MVSEKELLNIKSVLIFLRLLLETFLILRRIERDVIKMYIVLRVKFPLFFLDFNET